MKNLSKRFKYLLITIFVTGLILANVVAYFHAYKFTHFSDPNLIKTSKPESLSFKDKLATIIFGINNPRPGNKSVPSVPYQTVRLNGHEEIECWEIKTDSAKGTVALFHGFSGEKSGLLDKAELFQELGYSVLLVDFYGSGGSDGDGTSIGYFESEDVNACVDYLQNQGETNIILFGTSMGSAAILKSFADYSINVNAIIIECPFGTLLETVESRFEDMNIPSFPMAYALVLWGGWQNGFNGFSHNPEEYAKHVDKPTLLMYGEKDLRVSRNETDRIFDNLQGQKTLSLFPEAGHENYLNRYQKEWVEDIQNFLKTTLPDAN